MPNKQKKESPKRKSNLRLGKETYGDMPIEKCFKEAFEPYFNPNKAKDLYLNRLG
ncbi:hypothetical protein [Oceanobacillus kapialis]|uniref:Uncharacterized protein n=1 Tax=Oceanobacillus kapialis TaxID=481353 RepID=A0ABW5Q076_9BACI